jgi:Resolvase, N terminal domain
MCRAYRAALVVANVSRLTRSVAFLSRLLEADVEIRFVDLPSIEGATGRFILQQMASVAELGAGMIGERTKRSLAAAKARGQKLGGFRGYTPDRGGGANGRKARGATARARSRPSSDHYAPRPRRLAVFACPRGEADRRRLADAGRLRRVDRCGRCASQGQTSR